MNQIIRIVLALSVICSSASARPKRPTPEDADKAAKAQEDRAYNQHYQMGERLLEKAVTSSDYRLALVEFKAAEMIPHSVTPDLFMHIAECSEQIGDYETAINYYELAVSIPYKGWAGSDKATLRMSILRKRLAQAATPPPRLVVPNVPPTPPPTPHPTRGVVRQTALISIAPSVLVTVIGAAMMGVAWDKRQSLRGTYPTPENLMMFNDAHTEYNIGSGILGVGTIMIAADVGLLICAYAFPDTCP